MPVVICHLRRDPLLLVRKQSGNEPVERFRGDDRIRRMSGDTA
jgi:hypothetical protein